MRPFAAWISRKRSGHGFGRKSFRPLRRACTLASKASPSAGCSGSALACVSCQTASITGLSAGRTFGDAAVQLATSWLLPSGVRIVPALRSSVGSSTTIDMRCGDTGRPNTLACAPFQLTISDCCSPCSVTVSGPVNSAISSCGL